MYFYDSIKILLSVLVIGTHCSSDILEDCSSDVLPTKPAVICTKLIPDNRRCNDYEPAIRRLCPYWCGKCSDYSCGISGTLDCAQLKAEGKCTSANPNVQQLMKEHCAGVCGLCNDQIITETSALSACYDKDPKFCYNNAHNCETEEVYDLLTDICPETCNRCFVDVDESELLETYSSNTVDNTAGQKCIDRMPNCETAYKQYCSKAAYSAVMHRYCPVTCNFCTVTVNNNNNNDGQQECFDESVSCKIWALKGYCNNPSYSLQTRRMNCAKTCGFC